MIQLQSIIKPEQLFWRQVCMTSLAQIWQCGLCLSVVSAAPATFCDLVSHVEKDCRCDGCLMKGCTTSMLMSMPWTAKAGIAKNCRIHCFLWQFWRKFDKVIDKVIDGFSTFRNVSLCFSWHLLAGQSPLHLAAKAGLGDVMHWLAAKASSSSSLSNTGKHTGNLRKFSDV